jgi:hypothetical protein
MKIKLGATIPTTQYGNLQPEFEVEADTLDAGLALIEPKMQALWDKYSEKPLVTRTAQSTTDDFVELDAFVGGKIWYSASKHEYRNDKGEIYLSGSQYAGSFDKPFDAQSIAGKMADKSGVPTQDILKMWEMKRDISNGYGTALHLAMQLYGEYHKHSEAFEKNYHIHDLAVFKDAVESFYKDRHDEEAYYEVLVVDHERKYAGQIDRLVKGKEGWMVEDFKTNAELDPKKLDTYWKQLSFYASILEAGKKPVSFLSIHHWNGREWLTINAEKQEVV